MPWWFKAAIAAVVALIAWLVITDRLNSDYLLVNPATPNCYLQTPDSPRLLPTSCQTQDDGYLVIFPNCPALNFTPARASSKKLYICVECSGSGVNNSCALNRYGKDVRWQIKGES